MGPDASGPHLEGELANRARPVSKTVRSATTGVRVLHFPRFFLISSTGSRIRKARSLPANESVPLGMAFDSPDFRCDACPTGLHPPTRRTHEMAHDQGVPREGHRGLESLRARLSLQLSASHFFGEYVGLGPQRGCKPGASGCEVRFLDSPLCSFVSRFTRRMNARSTSVEHGVLAPAAQVRILSVRRETGR
jgi:hypothetical protein